MGVITFNGVSSSTFGIEVVHPPHFYYSERQYSYTEISGRNGYALVDAGGYKNVTIEYELNFVVNFNTYESFQEQAVKISEWLHSGSGYCRLEDTYSPTRYMMAAYSESNTIENILDGGGKFTIHFNAKPQRWLKSGEISSTIASGATLNNPTKQLAYPLFYLTSTQDGSLTIGENVINIKNTSRIYTPVVGDYATYNGNKFLFDGTKWWAYTPPENPMAYVAQAADVVSYDNGTEVHEYVFTGNGWQAYTSYTNAKFVGKTITDPLPTYQATVGDIAIYNNNKFLFDGVVWWVYTEPSDVTAYEVQEGDVVWYNGDKFVFNGVIWNPYTTYTNAKFIGITGTEIEADSEVTTISLYNNEVGTTITAISAGNDTSVITMLVTKIMLDNRDAGTSTTAISAGSTISSIVLGNYEVVAGDLVIYNGSQFVWNGTKWVVASGYTGDKKFQGYTSTVISADSTVTIVGLEGLFIDCDSGDAYLVGGQINCNKLVSCPEFPFLSPGNNMVVYENLSNVQITPRWYMI